MYSIYAKIKQALADVELLSAQILSLTTKAKLNTAVCNIYYHMYD